MKKINLAILNITSFAGYCTDAEHLYGTLILSEVEKVNINNVVEWNVRHLGENIEIFHEMSFEDAVKLDEKDGGDTYKIAWKHDLKDTNRFFNVNEIVNAGIKKWLELGIDCPFISLYESERYKFYENGNLEETVILQYGEIKNPTNEQTKVK